MSIVLPFIFFSILNIGMVIITKRKFGVTLPLTLMSSALIIYYSQLIFKTFDVAYYALILLFLFSFIIFIKRRRDKEIIKKIISNGFYCYIIISLLIIIIDYGRHYRLWDEFSHWGKMVKEMMRIGRFYTDQSSNLMAHKYYPPFAGVFELLVCKLQGGYSEMGTTMGIHLLEFSLLFPWLVEKFDSVGNKWYEKILNLILFIVVGLMLIFSFDSQPQEILGIFSTIYNDILLVLIYAYGISIIIDNKERNSLFGYVAVLISSVSIILTKQIGIAFIMLLALFYILNTFNSSKKYCPKSLYKRVIYCLGIIIIPLANHIIWNNYVKSIGKVNKQFSLEKIKIREIISVINGSGSVLRTDTYKRYINALFIQKVNLGFFSLSYVIASIIALYLLFLIYMLAKGKFSKKEFINISFLFIAGSVGYAFTMFVMYIFCFSEVEMNYLIGFNRYMGTYILSEYLILLFITVELLTTVNIKTLTLKRMAVIFLVSIILSSLAKLSDLSPQILRGEPEFEYKEIAEYITKHISGNGRKYLFLISSNNAKNTYYLNYYLDEVKVDGRYISKDIASYSPDNELWNDIVNDIKEDEYLYIMNASESVDKVLGKYTEEKNITDETLYEVKIEAGELLLVKVE